MTRRRRNGDGCFAAFNRQLTRLIARLDRLEEEVAAHERQWRLVTGRDGTGELDRQAVYLDILANMFSAEELAEICFRLGMDYESLPATSKPGKAREMLLHMERRNRLERLYDIVQQKRPFLFDDRE